VSYDSSGFVAMPWRIGSIVAPIPSENAPLEPWQRKYDTYKRIIAMEVVGSHGVVRQLAKALRSGEHVSLLGDHQSYRGVGWASGGLVPFYKRLPSGPTHALFLHPQTIPSELNPSKPVYAIGREEDPGHAYRMLNAALPIPLLPEWTSWLIAAGRDDNLVFDDLTSDGLWGIEIIPDVAQWAEIVRTGLTTGALQWTS